MTEDKFEVQSCVSEAAIRVCSAKDPQLTLKITLSSLAMREEHSTTEEGIDLPPSFTPILCLLFGRMLPCFYLTFIWQQMAEREEEVEEEAGRIGM